MINLMEPIFNDEMLNAAKKALSNEFFLRGDSVKGFENDFQDYLNVKHALALNSGTTALHLALLAFGIGKGDYVITTPATFIATANAISYTGAYPLFVDISFDDYNIDPNKVEDAIKKHQGKVKAIMPVHLYGFPSKMNELLEITEKYGLKLIEDACQAHGGSYKGKKLGSIGDAAAFSFYPSKNLTVAGDGGLLTTNDDDVADYVTRLRDCGRSNDIPGAHDMIGYTARLNTVNAAIGRVQLKYLDEWVNRRREIVNIYYENLSDISEVILPPQENDNIQSSWHLFALRVKERERLQSFLKENGIRTGIHYHYPVHLQKPYLELGYKEEMFPNAEQWAKEIVSIPLHTKLTDDDVSLISNKIQKYYKK